MEVTVITELGRTISSDKRYRRSPRPHEALAYQCAHIQEQLGLQAMVLSDDTGSSWVGSGDLALCRLLSRSAPALAGDIGDQRQLQLRTIQSLRSDLQAEEIATLSLGVPRSQRRIYITGVGRSRMLEHGLHTTAQGGSRILGWHPTQPARNPVEAPADTAARIEQLTWNAWQGLRLNPQSSEGQDTPGRWASDHRRYEGRLTRILQPALDLLEARGVVADDPWRHYRLRSVEVELTPGLFQRTLSATLRDARAGVRLGRLDIDLYHRHDTVDLPACPRLRLRWG
jgi:hypothetical protein